MGIIRGGLLVVISVLLFVVFLAGNVLWTLDKSLDYDILKPELVSAVEDAIEDKINVDEVVGEEFEKMEDYCENHSEYVFSQNELGSVSCDVVEQGPDAVVDSAVEDFVDGIYEGQTEQVDFNFSKLNDSVHSYFYIVLAVALVLFVLVFFLAEAKSNAFIITGSLLSISALPFVKIEQFFSWIPFEFVEYLSVFFSQASSVFWISLIIGLIILGVGIVTKFFGVGFKLFEFFNKMKSKKVSKNNKPVMKEQISKKSK